MKHVKLVIISVFLIASIKCTTNSPNNYDSKIVSLQDQIDSLKNLNQSNKLKTWVHTIKQSEISVSADGIPFYTVQIVDSQMQNAMFIAAYAQTNTGLVSFFSINGGNQLKISNDTLSLETVWSNNIGWPNPPIDKNLVIQAIEN